MKYRHNMTDSPACKTCGYIETSKHKLTGCDAKETWEGTKRLLMETWSDVNISECHHILIEFDPRTEEQLFEKIWIAAGFIHYQLTARERHMEHFIKVLKNEYKVLLEKDVKIKIMENI